MDEVTSGSCPEYVVRAYYGGSATCGRPIKRNGKCGLHAYAVEQRETKKQLHTEYVQTQRRHRERITASLAAGNNIASLLRERLPDVHFIAQVSGAEVVLEVDLDGAAKLLRHIDPTRQFTLGSLGADVEEP